MCIRSSRNAVLGARGRSPLWLKSADERKSMEEIYLYMPRYQPWLPWYRNANKCPIQITQKISIQQHCPTDLVAQQDKTRVIGWQTVQTMSVLYPLWPPALLNCEHVHREFGFTSKAARIFDRYQFPFVCPFFSIECISTFTGQWMHALSSKFSQVCKNYIHIIIPIRITRI
jgi:hypothetical protein